MRPYGAQERPVAFAAPRRGEGASLTYGHYSKGERVKLRSAIDKLKYSPQVMRLIKGAAPHPQGSRRTRKRRKRR